jgi:hypothetical protein
MIKTLQFLCGFVCATVVVPAFANVATTLGSNKTAYNGTGSISNNQWNTMMNARTNVPSSNVEANFGNCNAAILRCASPKCSSGGCTDMSVARPIVAGCVNANASCKKHGDDLIDYITAQVVAQSTAKLREQEQAVEIARAQADAAAANAASADAAANAQMEQMQIQMQQMQSQMAESMNAMREQMAAQSESQAAQIQTALDRQNSYSASVVSAPVDSATTDAMGLDGLSVAEQLAIKNGLSADLLVREQMGGQIETAIDDAMIQMKKLKETLDEVLEYAGCDSAANYCTGPRRVKKFKELVNNFFDPYEGVLDSVYDALVLALSLGVDVNDAVMLLSGSCNIWGKYNCAPCNSDLARTYSVDKNDGEGICAQVGDNYYWRVAKDEQGKVHRTQKHCRLVQTIKDGEEVLREWIDSNTGMMGATQVECASDVIENLGLLRGRRKETTIGIEDLRNLVAQDSSVGACGKKDTDDYTKEMACDTKICTVNKESEGKFWQMLQTAVRTKKLPEDSANPWCSSNLDYYKNRSEQVTEIKEITKNSVGDGGRLACRDIKDRDFCAWQQECEWEVDKCQLKNATESYANCAKYTVKATCNRQPLCKWWPLEDKGSPWYDEEEGTCEPL